MSKIAIKGHASRGKEVIQILEMIGGKNVYNLSGDTSYAYYVYECGEIRTGTYIYGNEPYTFFTLEEFESKYPYKVGDQVRVPEYVSEVCIEVCISKMYWDGSEVQYEVVTDEVEWYSTKELNEFNKPDKEEIMDRKYNVEEYLKVWEETEKGLEVVVNDKFELKEDNGKFYIIKKQYQYPKNYDECCQYLGCDDKIKMQLIGQFTQLINARNAYWKIAGEEMGLGKPWEPDYKNPDIDLYVIINIYNQVEKAKYGYGFQQCVLTFPTEEMRDAFYENFKDTIEACKDFL